MWEDPKKKQDDLFYEIEYDSTPFPGRSEPIPGVGKFVRKEAPQPILPPQIDPVRERFNRMRDIARSYGLAFYSSRKFYDKRVQRENARVFYEQGIFMKDFEDDYEKVTLYSSYYPSYQMMGYDQLRTYFTWRTRIRRGELSVPAISYLYMYLYELVNGIGVADPVEGLERMLQIRRFTRESDSTLDKYVLRWMKDYHIYYELPWSFAEFVTEQGLKEHYPELDAEEDFFGQYCSISRYDIRKSKFYTKERENLIQTCFSHVMEHLQMVFRENGIPFEESIFQPRKNMSVWEPFRGALFCPWVRQRDRQVRLSSREIYVCSHNNWTYSSVIITESGKKLIGYVMKQMEVVLRGLMKYPYRLTADIRSVTHEAIQMLAHRGLSLEKIVTEAVTEYYWEATKTVVRINPGQLIRIRQEAWETQEKLTVEEEESGAFTLFIPEAPILIEPEAQEDTATADMAIVAAAANEPAGPWEELWEALSGTERRALAVLANGGDIRQFADEQGIMLEVLLDGINEKAMDAVGDSLTDEEYMIYEDYMEEVKGMVERL